MSQAVAISLYEKLGGEAAVKAVVTEFYKRVLGDASLKGFFEGVDMTRQTQSQIDFLSQALGGPENYTGRSMRDAHHGMGITEHHFGLVAGHLVDALKWAKVPQADIDAVVALVGPLQADIVMV